MCRGTQDDGRFWTCANSNCSASFDYRQGRLFRFHEDRAENGAHANEQFVRHFWLCKQCARTYTLEYLKNSGVAVLRPLQGSCESVAAV